MIRVLFVSNGHGEAAIADCIARAVKRIRADARLDHLALVGEPPSGAMRDVGPRRTMPSGGLIAMGNAANIVRDVSAGLLRLTWQQRAFLRGGRGYGAAVAVGDAYSLAMTLRAGVPTVFVGTAKSVAVARYGWFERRLLGRARARFVRDPATARALCEAGVDADAANAIVDLFASEDDPAAQRAVGGFDPALALFPGSRESAYADAALLLGVTGELARALPSVGAALSVAPSLDHRRVAAAAARAGWDVRTTDDECLPFVLSRGGRDVVRAWRGPLGPLLRRVALVLGQAGTANEAAAAAGVPVVAFERGGGAARWYRRRQRGLLGEALAVFPAEPAEAAARVHELLNDAPRRARMAECGRARMGPPGAAHRIAERIVAIAEGA